MQPLNKKVPEYFRRSLVWELAAKGNVPDVVLAEAAGLNRTTVTKIRNGKLTGSVDSWCAIADACERRLEEMISDGRGGNKKERMTGDGKPAPPPGSRGYIGRDGQGLLPAADI